MKTQAVYFIEPGKAEVRECDVGDPAAGEVQVRSLANGICMGEVVQFTGVLKLPMPRIPGHEGIGVVTRLGPRVRGVAEGDVVTIWNDPRVEAEDAFPWQLDVNLPAGRVVKFSRLPDDPAVMLGEPAACVATALRSYDIAPGDRVLLMGAGYMGLLNVQGLAHCPLAELAVTDLRAGNLALASEFGATETVHVGTAEGEERMEQLKAEPFDLVIDAAGAPEVLQATAAYVRPGGRVGMFAWHHGPVALDMDTLHIKGVTMLNSSPWMGRDHNVNMMARGVRLLERGILDMRKLVTHRHRLADVQAAMQLAAERPEGYIKGVLTFE
jgi:threonine dehydrogenase-like Zn-dependent dehydrogenase